MRSGSAASSRARARAEAVAGRRRAGASCRETPTSERLDSGDRRRGGQSRAARAPARAPGPPRAAGGQTERPGWRWRRASPVDVILLDMLMPGLSGYEVLARLKAERGAARDPGAHDLGARRHRERQRAASRSAPTTTWPSRSTRWCFARACSVVPGRSGPATSSSPTCRGVGTVTAAALAVEAGSFDPAASTRSASGPTRWAISPASFSAWASRWPLANGGCASRSSSSSSPSIDEREGRAGRRDHRVGLLSEACRPGPRCWPPAAPLAPERPALSAIAGDDAADGQDRLHPLVSRRNGQVEPDRQPGRVRSPSSGKRVAVVDTDIQSPGIHMLFGLEDTRQLRDAQRLPVGALPDPRDRRPT